MQSIKEYSPSGLPLSCEAVLRCALFALAIAPAVYLFAVIQYSAITVPFWDHTELIKILDSYKSGMFRLEQLWAPHNHSRPFTYRSIYILNALITDWDLRSEYVYMYASIYGAFLIHLRILWLQRGSRADLVFLCLFVVLAAFYFSPVGHNNHWWSMMLQLNLASLFILLALWQLSRNAGAWSANAWAALWCWLASYTLTNGLVAMVACAAIALVASRDRHQFVARLGFWAANLALLLLLYLPGLPDEGGQRPALGDALWFAAVYIGSPVGSFLHFRFSNLFDVIQSTRLNGLLGVAMIAGSVALGLHAWRKARQADFASLLLLGCLAFVGGSAVLTAWGRAAFDQFGVASANSSRYVIFSSYAIFGAIHYCARYPTVLPTRTRRPSYLFILTAALVAAGAVTYWRGLAVYESAHQFNSRLTQVYYSRNAQDDTQDRLLFPDVQFARYVRAALFRHELGPYRHRWRTIVEVPARREFVRAVELQGGVQVAQQLSPDRDRLVGLELRVVTFGRKSRSTATWELIDVQSTPHRRVAGGTIHSRHLTDWGYVRLALPPESNSLGRTYNLIIRGPAEVPPNSSFGVPLFAAPPDLAPAVVTSPSSNHAHAPATLNYVLRYDD